MYNKERQRIITVYSRNIKETFSILEEKFEEMDEEKLIIRADFNARTGRKGGPIKDGFDDIEGTQKM